MRVILWHTPYMTNISAIFGNGRSHRRFSLYKLPDSCSTAPHTFGLSWWWYDNDGYHGPVCWWLGLPSFWWWQPWSLQSTCFLLEPLPCLKNEPIFSQGCQQQTFFPKHKFIIVYFISFAKCKVWLPVHSRQWNCLFFWHQPSRRFTFFHSI